MKKTRKKHSATFKAQLAIEAIKEQETLGELAKCFGLWIIRTMLTPKSGLWNDHFNADFAFIFHVIPADTDPLSLS